APKIARVGPATAAFAAPVAGSAGTLTNRGTIRNASLLQADVVNRGTLMLREETRVTGAFEQSDSGTLQIGADFAAGTVDRLIVEGDAALAGKVAVAARRLLPGRLPFLQVEGKATGMLEGSRLNMFDFNVE